VLMSLPAVTLLFLVGTAFSWFILMPPALGFLEGFQQNLFRSEWTADLYLSFVTSLIFWMGVAFETPLVFFVLGLLGLVSAMPLIRNWRVAIVGAAVAAAFITPTVDPVNMALVMGPLLALYLMSIGLVFIARRIARIDDSSAV
jgi:sec-independent protein translocase protein TatC